MSRRSVVALFSFLAALAAAELMLRARWTAPWYRRLLADQAEHQALEYTENRWGLRDRDYGLPKPPDRLRVLVLGDSFTHGTGVAEDALVFPELLEAALNERSWPAAPGGVEVLNGGLSGSLTKNWVRLFDQVADEFDPDLLLIVFFLRDGTTAGSGEYFADVRSEVGRLERDSLVYRHSYLYRTWLDVEIRGRVIAEYTGAFEAAYFGSEDETREWRRAQKNLLRLRDAARARGTEVGLVVFPILVELTGRYPFRPQVDLLVGFGQANGFPTHDLLPAYLGREAADLWVSPFDQHPNAAGHALAAESMLPFVARLLEGGADVGRALLAGYLLLVASSHAWMLTREVPPFDPQRPQPGRTVVDVPALADDGAVPGERCVLSVLEWGSAADGERLPVVLLHGSPGSARNWEDLGPRLGALGRRALALDLPGFGRSSPDVPSYSIRAHARAVLALLDALAIERAHLVSWSMGGGVTLHVAELAPERVASIAQIAALGAQEAEGSGSYHFEHFKYALLWFGLTVVPEALPHFGALGPYGRGKSFVRNFWDTDQRPLRGIMERLETPTLILHGKDDFLVPAWAAETSHELIAPSRLVMFDASHFLPLGGDFGQLEQTLEHLVPFLDRHDQPGVSVERAYLDLSPPAVGLARLALPPYELGRRVPWWLQLALLTALAWRSPRLIALATGLLVGGLQLDFGLGLVGCWSGVIGRAARVRPGWVRALLGLGLAGALVVAGSIVGTLAPGPILQWLAAGAVLLVLWRRVLWKTRPGSKAFPPAGREEGRHRR